MPEFRPKSRQCKACVAAYVRAWAERGGRENWRQAARRARMASPEKKRARWAVYSAVRRGVLLRGPCEVGQGCAGRIEAHHDDYTRPLAVRWLCARHHRAEHTGRAA